MAEKTFTNQGGQTSIQLAGNAEPVVIGPGQAVTTDNEELKTALRKAGKFTEGAKKKDDAPYEYKKDVPFYKKEND